MTVTLIHWRIYSNGSEIIQWYIIMSLFPAIATMFKNCRMNNNKKTSHKEEGRISLKKTQ